MKEKILLFLGAVTQGVQFFKQDCHVSGAGGDLPVPDEMIDTFSLFSFGSEHCVFKDG